MTTLTEPFAGETPINRIEKRARHYADVRSELISVMGELNEKINALTREKLPLLKKLAARAAEKHADLEAALSVAPHLFEKPRTVVFHGIKVGFRKNEGCLEFDDAEVVVKRIQQLLDAPDHYLRTVTQPNKETLASLSAADLKRLGCRLIETSDSIVIKPVAGEIDKKIQALLKGAEAEASSGNPDT
jgi:hypothetical protein